MKVNGFELFAVLPLLVNGEIEGYAVAGEDARGWCAAGVMKSLTGNEWGNDHYYKEETPGKSRRRALAWALDQAGASQYISG